MCIITITEYACGDYAGSTTESCGIEGCERTTTTDYLDYDCERCSGDPDSGYSTSQELLEVADEFMVENFKMVLTNRVKYSCGHYASSSFARVSQGCIPKVETDFLGFKCEDCDRASTSPFDEECDDQEDLGAAGGSKICALTCTEYSCGHYAGSFFQHCSIMGCVCVQRTVTDYLDYECEKCSHTPPALDEEYDNLEDLRPVNESDICTIIRTEHFCGHYTGSIFKHCSKEQEKCRCKARVETDYLDYKCERYYMGDRYGHKENLEAGVEFGYGESL